MLKMLQLVEILMPSATNVTRYRGEHSHAFAPLHHHVQMTLVAGNKACCARRYSLHHSPFTPPLINATSTQFGASTSTRYSRTPPRKRKDQHDSTSCPLLGSSDGDQLLISSHWAPQWVATWKETRCKSRISQIVEVMMWMWITSDDEVAPVLMYVEYKLCFWVLNAFVTGTWDNDLVSPCQQ